MNGCWFPRLQLSAAFLAATLLSGCMKTDPESVKSFVLDEVTQQFPNATIETSTEGEVAVRHTNGRLQTINLSPIQEGCKRVPRSCGGLVARLLVVMTEGLDAKQTAVQSSRLVPIISSVEPRTPVMREGEPQRVYTQPIAEKLGVRFGALLGDTVTFLSEAQFGELGLSPERALAEAIKNAETVAAPSIVPFPGEANVFQVFGALPSAAILTRVHSEKIKELVKCKSLAVAFPRRGIILAANAESDKDVARLSEISARFQQPASAVISDLVYLVTDRGMSALK